MLCDMPDMVRCGPAASAYNVYKSILRPVFEEMCGLFGLFVIFTHGIWQPCIGISRSIARRYLAELLDMRPHLLCAQRTVKSDAQRPGMHHRHIKSFQRLPAKRSPARIRDGPTYRYR